VTASITRASRPMVRRLRADAISLMNFLSFDATAQSGPSHSFSHLWLDISFSRHSARLQEVYIRYPSSGTPVPTEVCWSHLHSFRLKNLQNSCPFSTN